MKIEDVYYVNKYEIGRAYGGPEEGGWWFDYGIFEGCEAMFTTYEEAREWADALLLAEGPQPSLSSVSTDYVVAFFVEEESGADWPERKPQYE